MPIFTPGKRDRSNRKVGATQRSAVAVLSLTAMVDMFTVLAVFLLQTMPQQIKFYFCRRKSISLRRRPLKN